MVKLFELEPYENFQKLLAQHQKAQLNKKKRKRAGSSASDSDEESDSEADSETERRRSKGKHIAPPLSYVSEKERLQRLFQIQRENPSRHHLRKHRTVCSEPLHSFILIYFLESNLSCHSID